jgi:hypothetical protein
MANSQSTKPFKKLDCQLAKTALLKMPDKALKIYLAHFTHEGQENQSYPAVSTLLEMCDIGDRHTVYKWRTWLVDNKWLKKVGEIEPKRQGEFAIPIFSCTYDGTVAGSAAHGKTINRGWFRRSRSGVVPPHQK